VESASKLLEKPPEKNNVPFIPKKKKFRQIHKIANPLRKSPQKFHSREVNCLVAEKTILFLQSLGTNQVIEQFPLVFRHATRKA